MNEYKISGDLTINKAYFGVNLNIHSAGDVVVLVWGIANSIYPKVAGNAGLEICYRPGLTTTLVTTLWGVFIRQKVIHASKGTNNLLDLIFILFLSGIISIINPK